MRNLKDFVSDWIRDKETDECRGDMVNCGNVYYAWGAASYIEW